MKFENQTKISYAFTPKEVLKKKYYAAYVKGINRAQNVILTHESKLLLAAEPENKFDKNAVKVVTEDKKLFTGYLEKDIACIIAPLLISNHEIKCQILGPSKECSTWYEILIVV